MQECTVAQTKLGFQSSVGCCAENKTGSYQPPPTSLGANRRVVRLPRGTALCALSFSARRSKRLRTPEEHVCVCVCVCVFARFYVGSISVAVLDFVRCVFAC